MTNPADTVIDFAGESTEQETGVSYNVQNRSVFSSLSLLEMDKLCYIKLLKLCSKQDLYEGVQSHISGEVAGQVRAFRK